jgi:hypothetical protein
MLKDWNRSGRPGRIGRTTCPEQNPMLYPAKLRARLSMVKVVQPGTENDGQRAIWLAADNGLARSGLGDLLPVLELEFQLFDPLRPPLPR